MNQRKLAVGVAATAAALLAAPPVAFGAADPINDGTTTIELANGFASRLANKGVGLSAAGGAAVNGTTVTAPIHRGQMDPTNGAGTLRHDGSLTFKHGKKHVTVRRLSVELDGSSGSLSGTVHRARLKLFRLSGESSARDGFFVDIGDVDAELTAKAASTLNGALGTNAFQDGAAVGTLASEPIARTVTITGGTVDLTPSGAPNSFAAKTLMNGITITPIRGASASGGQFHFNVGGGHISLSGLIGRVRLVGGLRLTKSGACTTDQYGLINDQSGLFTSAIADIQAPPSGCPGLQPRAAIADLDMSGATTTDDYGAREITVDGETQSINGLAALLLNQVYSNDSNPSNDFAAGDVVGTITMTLQAQ